MDSSWIGSLLTTVLGFVVFCGAVLVGKPIVRRWGDSGVVRGLLWSASGLSVTAVILALTLFLRMRERFGEWPSYRMAWRVESGRLRYVDPNTDVFATHFLSANVAYHVAFASVLILGPLVLGNLWSRRTRLLPLLVYVATWLALTSLWMADPHHTMHWLLT